MLRYGEIVHRETVEACAKIAESTQPTMVDSGDIRIGRSPVYQPNPYAATVAANIRALQFTRPAAKAKRARKAAKRLALQAPGKGEVPDGA